MSGFEIILSMTAIAASAGSVFFVSHIVWVSGRDRPNDPELVREFVRTAPMHRLNDVLE